ncbi:MAG: hypothetical protein WC705_00035 [Candidatus Paceibacterota bacterium]|jgi:hypothetical protein
MCYSRELKLKIQEYFKKEFGQEIDGNTANEYLDSLVSLYLLILK